MIQILVKAVQLLTFCILCIKQEAEIIWSYIIFFYFGRTYAWELYTYCLVIFLRQGSPFIKNASSSRSAA